MSDSRKFLTEIPVNFVLSPSDHFFDADIALIAAFVDEEKSCRYQNR